jgi:hypothetical protein
MSRVSLPPWFHRANWAGGAIACLFFALAPLFYGFGGPLAYLWAVAWGLLGVGAANNARLGVDSLRYRDRLRGWKRRE